MRAFSVSPTFQSAVFIPENENEDEGDEEGDGDWQESLWKLKKKRNGLKGRTPKHPMNKRPYTC